MRAWVSVLLFFLCGCQRPPVETPESSYEQAVELLRRGDLGGAGQRVDSALRAHRGKLPGDLEQRFRLLKAEVLLTGGEHKEARPLLDVASGRQGGFEKIEARRLYLTAVAERLAGRYDESLKRAGEAGAMAAQAKETELVLQLKILAGLNLVSKHQFAAGEEMLQQAEREARQQFPGQVAEALRALSLSRIRQRRFDEALPYAERSAAVSGQLGQRLKESRALGNIAICYAYLGEFNMAAEYQQRADRLFEENGDKLSLLRGYGTEGNIHIESGAAATAVAPYRRAYDLATALGLEDEAALWAGNLSLALIEAGNWDEADRWNRRCLELRARLGRQSALVYAQVNSARIEAGRGRSREAELEYRRILEEEQPVEIRWLVYAGLAQVLAAKQETREAEHYFRESLALIEKAQSELLQQELRITYLARLIEFYQAYVDFLVRQGKAEEALRVADSSRARVLEERLGHGLAAAPSKNHDYRHISRRTGARLLSYWLAPRRSFVWLVDAASVRLFELPDSSELSRMINNYRRIVEEGLHDPIRLRLPEAEKLATTLLGPVKDLIPPGARVIVVPDGALHHLNLETLPVGGDQAHYWLEDVRLAVSPSLACLNARSALPGGRPGSALLIGDSMETDKRFPRLQYAAEEMELIQRRFSAGAVEILKGEKASPQTVLSAPIQRYSIIHFSTHAEANIRSPLDSAIILSPEGQRYKLYARDLLNKRLNADLVTVSACSSAGVRAYAGEGLIGFSWVFLQAGARAVIAGLWDVNDRSTALLMDSLYAGLAAKKRPAEALHDAKVTMYREHSAYRRPYYWGPFQTYLRTP